MSEREEIFEAAIRDEDGKVWQVGRPGRHHHVMQLMPRHAITGEQGFVTNTLRFVDRFEACKIARDANQIIVKTGPDDELFSEDLW